MSHQSYCTGKAKSKAANHSVIQQTEEDECRVEDVPADL